jgi:Holliday junction resolvase-like predicted endonuclease
VRAQANRGDRRIVLGSCVLILVALGMLALAVGHMLTIAGSTLFVVTVLILRPYANDYVDEHLRRWHAGARAEEAVGGTLDELRREGWILLHDVRQEQEGNIDHIVNGAGGCFMIETKARRYDDAHLGKARRQAAKLHDALGVWVTPVICLNDRKGRPFKTHGVWIVPRREILDWLRAQRDEPAPFDALARFADSL